MKEVLVNDGYKRLGLISCCIGFVAASGAALFVWGDIKSGHPPVDFEDFGPYLLGSGIAAAFLHYTTFWGWGWIAAQKKESGPQASGARIARWCFVVFLLIQLGLMVFQGTRAPSFGWFHVLFLVATWPTLGWAGMYLVILISSLCQWVADGFNERSA
jgi:hypothetical protein